jgi:(4S)-4-hydroxy-5-phosphonooxypentane-2,3-dione isomerase
MYVVTVSVFVKPDHVEEFIKATIENAVRTRQEPGNLRFDVLQSVEDETRFTLYEAYRTENDFDRHHQAMHYLGWREMVTPWMALPRQGVKHKSLYPEDREW